MYGVKSLCFAAMLVCLGSSVVAKISLEDRAAMKEAMHPFVMQCVEEFSISKEELAEMMEKGEKGHVEPCFVSCLFKKNGFFDDQGMYDSERAMEFTKPFIKDEEDLVIMEKIRVECSKVNDEEVSDGEKGCERAKMLFECFKEHKSEINFEE